MGTSSRHRVGGENPASTKHRKAQEMARILVIVVQGEKSLGNEYSVVEKIIIKRIPYDLSKMLKNVGSDGHF